MEPPARQHRSTQASVLLLRHLASPPSRGRGPSPVDGQLNSRPALPPPSLSLWLPHPDQRFPTPLLTPATTGDRAVFSFYEGGRSCNGLEEALWRYRSIAPHVRMAGPTSFAPLILEAVEVVRQNHMQYHILVIIADGQVTRSVDLPPGHLSAQEHHTVQAIQYASNFPLSIIMVGVGDGPYAPPSSANAPLSCPPPPALAFPTSMFTPLGGGSRWWGHMNRRMPRNPKP
mmetsp:Transcript_32945/g.104901  ORF Transcript_32945/g.104901 Transcript_32945/m.104901 type:complete len:230 (-) Transcript_32945:383-1072(-)